MTQSRLFSRLRLTLAIATLAGMATCASSPPPAEWQLSAQGALREAVQAYLTGNDRVANAEFTRARADIASTGRIDLLARAELVRCAARVASVVVEPCTAYQAIASDAAAPERAYAAYIAGQWQALDAAALPAQHRAVVSGSTPVAALQAVEDPLARLVAAGALLQAGRLPPEGFAVAADTASAQGWRRPLLAWLGLQAKRARDAGQADEAARLQRRIDLIASGGAPVR